ncbi:MAG: hypothetical protein Q8N03_12990 [Ignavibacteria bacterium]|nr:hypothetical protein [Ignavibacteria bacterium]MDP3829679.1 hypothetical protein [Ignavibacteriaceae bacterium]
MRNIFYLSIFILSIMLFGCKSSIVDDPTLNIDYSVPEKSLVKLTIENSYNTVIKIPVDKEQNAGIYTVSIDVNDLAEGVYFYTLELKGVNSNYYSKTTKLLLLVK